LDDFIEVGNIKNIIIEGDFNVRIGELGGRGMEGGMDRCSKDKVIGNGGKKLVDWITEKGWEILNGKTEGDWAGEFICRG